MGVLSLGVGYWYWRAHEVSWQMMVFTTLTLSQMAHVMAIRSERRSVFRVGFLSNKLLLAAAILTAALQFGLIYTPSLQSIFGTVALPLPHVVVTFLAAAAIFLAVELEKRFISKAEI